ncbi:MULTISPECIES: NUDIX domain-containing protein [Streptomyces]|uniref:NUDIX domain-containing protein n=1 Tax=Streptomyces TaxID=1883 RepID=UPI000E696EB0|nr:MULTISPECIES: NUDIX hydrolase [Streptomyces]MDX3066042.1 NUDIX hydrolase [Streptomyces sp. ND04-05B]MDX3519595.1 NUDIX hydrolase [Streptomyces scabiei]
MTPIPARPTQSAAAVVRDAQGRILIVKPGYKDGWNLPGGGVDEGETPSQAAGRELREEVGVDQVIGRLLVSAYIQSEAGAHIYWVFDGGVISEEQKAGIRLQESELVDYRFSGAEEIGPEEIPPAVRAVWDQALRALRDGTTASLEVVR